jgi:hypothetical protein
VFDVLSPDASGWDPGTWGVVLVTGGTLFVERLRPVLVTEVGCTPTIASTDTVN